AAEELVGKLEAFKATVDGYVAGGTSTGSAAQIDTAIAAIQAEIKTPTGAGNVFDAAVVGAALAKLTPDTWTALPAASGATDTDAYKAAMKLDSTATAASFNQALTDLKDPTKGNWTGVQTQALDVTTATAEDVTAAVTALQKELDTLGLNISGAEVKTNKGIADVNITTQAGAWEAIKQIDSAIDQVNSARADLGALQTRFEKAIENIDIQNENISAAKGRIVDADFATETANLSRAQILQQAGTAMVAQANQLPQSVLSLLQ
ncbi:flagellin, partial [Salmonella enterica subsp. enterica serovar Dublin]|nr:flagellin [Salmonella enterica subsp. enterica serovar Dublin]